MATVYDCSNESELLEGLRAARGAIGRGELVVLPTDTVYGVAADAVSYTSAISGCERAGESQNLRRPG